MNNILFRPVQPDQDFEQLAAWFTQLEDFLNTEAGLKVYYQSHKDRIIAVSALNDVGDLLGFYWAFREPLHPGRLTFDLYVNSQDRHQGIGRKLYEDLERAAAKEQMKQLRVRISDNCPEERNFAERRGFTELSHRTSWTLDLEQFDDKVYHSLIARLESEGFLFTDMEALGNTVEVQRNLYQLNETTGMEVMGGSGEPSWESFEHFQASVCQADWYKPAGQIVAIDSSTGIWAAMSAITSFPWIQGEYGYNLHEGVDKRYRGRKLAQAVRAISIRYARDVLKVKEVRTHHNSKNEPIIAISRKFGYVQMPGTFLMEKALH